ncbi:M20 family metallopeptidase [Clostridium sp. HV4-5-A1G]|uniref:M20 family metallopeptidase n=1 Tax=Clostridium sp. HV4-5-A1G TaxID=2004595 RepID=UPI001239481D|nr:M20 family metallopeptidase [Clostridium sp. HV4-5-A1G]KAA8673365.1 amidohydrolase [Clostridium sp. HV4-5-A1G]
MANKDEIIDIVEEKRNLFIDVSDRIWEFAENSFREFKSCQLLCNVLEKEGFTVHRNAAGIDTAFKAVYGSGSPVIGILGEYDALYNLSQGGKIATKEPIVENGNGHGCGHNALGAGSLAAAVAVKDYLKKHNMSGTICYFGCPAEEGGSGKTYMVREKVFDGVDAVFGWHPQSINTVLGSSMTANIEAYFRFYGVSSHAADCPHLGRSALDAVELMDIGVNYLREHVIQDARIHYAITNSGGSSPNVVQSYAEVLYLVRAPKVGQTKDIYERIKSIAGGAALMTGTRVKVIFDNALSNLIINSTLSKIMYEKMLEIGPVVPDEKDLKYAEAIRSTLTEEQKNYFPVSLDDKLKDKLRKKAIADFIIPYRESQNIIHASSDVSDVSWVVPTAQCFTACYAFGTPGHSWQVVAQVKAEFCHKSMLMAGKVMALSALELFEKPELIDKAKRELKERLHGEKYICPIPPNIKPSLNKKNRQSFNENYLVRR